VSELAAIFFLADHLELKKKKKKKKII